MSSNQHQTLPALERDWMIAWTKKDRVTCERILAEDFLLTSARGVLMSKKDCLNAAMAAFCCERFDWKEIRVRAFGNVAIVHGRATQRASVDGQDWSVGSCSPMYGSLRTVVGRSYRGMGQVLCRIMERLNQTIERTASRRSTQLCMTSNFQPAATRAAARRSSSLSR
jgi:uncharacterized protein DUF4440